MKATFLQQAKHGISVDLEDGPKRHHVRIFNYETGEVPGVGLVELPTGFDMNEGAANLLKVARAMLSGEITEPEIGVPQSIEIP